MIKEIVKDHFLLQQKSIPASYEDLYIVDDLLDTIEFHREKCIGMAANMIGCLKTIMVVLDHDHYMVLINPQILSHSEKYYETIEGCLCHEEGHTVKRYEKIKVAYLDQQYKKRVKTFHGLTSQIIQHEMDHFAGKLI